MRTIRFTVLDGPGASAIEERPFLFMIRITTNTWTETEVVVMQRNKRNFVFKVYKVRFLKNKNKEIDFRREFKPIKQLFPNS